jgi:elongation factor G-like protein
MNEADWLRSIDPVRMLEPLQGMVPYRKLRLVACACCRRIWHLLSDDRSRRAVEVFERYADGVGYQQELQDAVAAARMFDVRLRGVHLQAARTVTMAWSAPDQVPSAAVRAVAARREELRRQADLLRDIFGNPFRPVPVDLAWLEWRGGLVTQIARSIYDERRFNDLPILADALEEAGCTEASILDHCRRRSAHAPGCWVLDGLLGIPLPGVPLGTPGGLTVRQAVEQEGLHAKQLGPRGSFACVILRVEPHTGSPPVLFFNAIQPSVPCSWVLSIEVALARFATLQAERGQALSGMRIILTGFRDNPVDSSARAFEQATFTAVRKALGLDQSS